MDQQGGSENHGRGPLVICYALAGKKLPTVGAVVPLGMSVLLDLQSTPKQTSKFGKFGISLLWLLWPVWTWIF